MTLFCPSPPCAIEFQEAKRSPLCLQIAFETYHGICAYSCLWRDGVSPVLLSLMPWKARCNMYELNFKEDSMFQSQSNLWLTWIYVKINTLAKKNNTSTKEVTWKIIKEKGKKNYFLHRIVENICMWGFLVKRKCINSWNDISYIPNNDSIQLNGINNHSCY